MHHIYLSDMSFFHTLFQKLDPTQFLRIHARASKINLDPAVAAAAESPLTMYVQPKVKECLCQIVTRTLWVIMWQMQVHTSLLQGTF